MENVKEIVHDAKKIKKSVSDAGKQQNILNSSLLLNYSKNNECDRFEDTSIFELFKKTLVTASFFNYNLDLELVDKLSESLDLKFNVEFKESSGNGLDKIQDVLFIPEDPIETETVCTGTQCQKQRSIMRDIYLHYDLPFNEDKHECLLKEINCNEEDLVTHIWLGKYQKIYIQL